jgi:hypothetical protein
MAGKGQGTRNKKSGRKSPKKYFVYFPYQGNLMLYCPTLSDVGMSRIQDLVIHLAGVKAIHRAECAFIVAGTCPDPPKMLKIGENPGSSDFQSFGLSLQDRREM